MQLKTRMARISYPHLFVAKAGGDGQGEAKFSICCILDKDRNAKDIEAINATMKNVAIAKWGEKLPTGVKKFLKDGSEKEGAPEMENAVFFNASSRNRPGVVDTDPNIPLLQHNGRPYAGCYCNVVIDIWALDHPKAGKRLVAELKAVQFARDGEPLGAGAPVKPTEVFQNEEEPDPDAVPTTARPEEAW